MFDDKLNENNDERNNNELNENKSLEEEMKAENHFYDGYEKKENEKSEEEITGEAEEIIDETTNEKSEEKENKETEEPKEKREKHHNSYYKETVKKKKNGSFKKVIAACVAVSLFGGTGLGAGYAAVNNIFSEKASSSDGTQIQRVQGDVKASSGDSSSDNVITLSSSDDAVAVINQVYPSIVNINVNVSGTTNYFGMSIPYESQGAGSGVIFDEDDQYVYIVTNDHVVGDANAISISVTGVENINAELVGTDSTNDIAVIKVLKSDLKSANVAYSIAKFGDSDKLNVGQSVIAIGNALGAGKSATGGMISILNKSLELNGKHLTVIQTSAPINPGNSGGALVDYNGEIIGINTAKTDTSVAEGMGYAIPSNTVKEIMKKLETEGTQPKPYIGIMGSDITDEISQLYKLPVGVLVRQVFDGSPAKAAGLEEGDIITSIDNKTVMNMEDLINELSNIEVGKTVELNVIRNNEAKTVSITIADANNATVSNNTNSSNN